MKLNNRLSKKIQIAEGLDGIVIKGNVTNSKNRDKKAELNT